MGSIARSLSDRKIENRSIFNNRMVVEVCEKVHFHYRNLRILLSLSDFLELCRGCSQAYERWQKLGSPEPKKGEHIELCRKKVAHDSFNENIQINLNNNLYAPNKGRIYAEGADFDEKHYIHLKLRDLRLELNIDEFKELADAVREAEGRLKDSDISALLQKA